MLLILIAVAILQILLMFTESSEQCGKINEVQLYNQEMRLAEDEYPWIGILWEKERSKIICGAVLITRRHAIIPAHCVSDRIDSITFKNHRGDEVAYELEEVAVHPDYALLKGNDIAIGRLNRVVREVQPICMPLLEEQQIFGQRLEMAGITFDNPSLRIKGHAFIATPEYCSNAFQNVLTNYSSSHHVCGYLSNNFLSGGALMSVNVVEENPISLKFYLTGLLVFGSRQPDKTKAASGFVNINSYKAWILRNIIE